MTTYAYPTLTRYPKSMAVEFVSNTEKYISPITGAIQTLDRGGERLMVTVTYSNLENADRQELIGFIAKMNGQQHRVNLPYHALSNRGTFGGTPLVAGASQTGQTLTVDGVGTVTNWIRTGDVFSVNGEMKIATADANSSAGSITLSFSPRLRSSPPDNDPINVTAPTGVFMLSSNSTGWSHIPGIFTDVTLQFIEDIAS